MVLSSLVQPQEWSEAVREAQLSGKVDQVIQRVRLQNVLVFGAVVAVTIATAIVLL